MGRYCHACAEAGLEAGDFEGCTIEPVFDPTICYRCGKDGGDTEFERAGAYPLCDACVTYARAWPFPIWLRAAAVVLLALLVYALVDGRRYFRAAAAVTRAERLVAKRAYAEAGEELSAALAAAPTSVNAILMKIEAELLAGHPDEAETWIEKFGDRRDDDPRIGRINGILERVGKAHEKLDEAGRISEEKDDARAALVLVREAQRLYPEGAYIREYAEALEGNVAFDDGDYAKFHAVAAKFAKRYPGNAQYVAQLASALACLYAATGDVARKVEAEAKLAEAERLGGDDGIAAYAKRIRHRLATREIISRLEYEKRFGKPDTDKKDEK